MTDAPTPGRMTADREAEIRGMLADHEWLSRDGRSMNKAGRAIRDLLAELDALRAERGEEGGMVDLGRRALWKESAKTHRLASLGLVEENAALQAENAALQAAVEAAREELRLIREKDTGAVYNPLVRIQMDMMLPPNKPADALAVVRQMQEAGQAVLQEHPTDEEEPSANMERLSDALEAAARLFGKGEG